MKWKGMEISHEWNEEKICWSEKCEKAEKLIMESVKVEIKSFYESFFDKFYIKSFWVKIKVEEIFLRAFKEFCWTSF